jgi:hypothetical protein
MGLPRPPHGPTVIPGPVSPDDHLLEELRERYPERRIYRTPWGWASYIPKQADEIQAETLQELAGKLDAG